jgi:hypothetical protein
VLVRAPCLLSRCSSVCLIKLISSLIVSHSGALTRSRFVYVRGNRRGGAHDDAQLIIETISRMLKLRELLQEE